MILIIDFGSQLTQLIARRVRELHRFCEILPYDAPPQQFTDLKPSGIILSGSGESVTEKEDVPKVAAELYDMSVPILAICFGMQSVAASLGGKVEVNGSKREYGHALLNIAPGSSSPLLDGVLEAARSDTGSCTDGLHVWMSHGDSVSAVPDQFTILGYTASCPVAIMANEQRKIYGVQFHPEVTETKQGRLILDNFLTKICRCPPTWTPASMVEQLCADVLTQVKPDEEVLLAVSGGVDSSVVACLLHRVLGRRLHCVMVNNGLLRLNEAEQTRQAFALSYADIDFTIVDAADQFYDALRGVTEPEAKRKVIGSLFIKVFEKFVENTLDHKVKWLAQGTIYPDIIESARAGKSALIKSHHNVGGLPEKMNFKLLEPIRKLFKDEVRTLGLQLNLPNDFLWRHPFPGPGLGVRCLGEVTKERTDKLREADNIYLRALREKGLYLETSQAFAVLLPCKSVAVKGDARAYEEVIALRAVTTTDFMTARCTQLPFAFLQDVARNIVNVVEGVSRVTFDLCDKPPGTIEWE